MKTKLFFASVIAALFLAISLPAQAPVKKPTSAKPMPIKCAAKVNPPVVSDAKKVMDEKKKIVTGSYDEQGKGMEERVKAKQMEEQKNSSQNHN
jgi:hypothetical protein